MVFMFQGWCIKYKYTPPRASTQFHFEVSRRHRFVCLQVWYESDCERGACTGSDLRLEVCSQTVDKISLRALTPGYRASFLFYCSSKWEISVSVKDTHIFLLDGALFTVVCIRDSWSSTDDTAALVGAIVTLITDAHQGTRPHIGITDHTFAITWGEQHIRLSSWWHIL